MISKETTSDKLVGLAETLAARFNSNDWLVDSMTNYFVHRNQFMEQQMQMQQQAPGQALFNPIPRNANGVAQPYFRHIHNEYCPVNCRLAGHVHNE